MKFVLAVWVVFLAVSAAQKRLKCGHLTSRIPSAIAPELYELTLQPHLPQVTFNGSVTIHFKVKDNLACLPVHKKDLVILTAELFARSGKSVKIGGIFEMKEFDYLVLELTEPLLKGDYRLVFTFAGNGFGKMSGFYGSSYQFPGEANERYLMTTKFEPNGARQAFPCFDEPDLKAKFLISAIRPKIGYLALSNSKVLSKTTEGSNVRVNFQMTPVMSTYLVAVIVSDFSSLRPLQVNNNGTNIPLRVYSPSHLVNSTTFALKVSKKVMEFFVKYYDIPYVLPKMDMIAIPDFISGAMENWGLITYRETRLMMSTNEESFDAMRKIIHVIAHELAHQWFGNLVTMKWWDDLWLNEGFARFMEYKGADVLGEGATGRLARMKGRPNLIDLKMQVMAQDALQNSHPIVMKVEDTNQISEIFDSISYAKGASILNMLESTIGEDVFKRGVQMYLKSHMFSNAASEDLWRALGQVSNISLATRMPTWAHQMGMPVVSVRKDGDVFHLTQERFLSDITLKFNVSASPYKYRWDIPICYRNLNGRKEHRVWFLRTQNSVKLKSKSVLKLNCQGISYYRVNYDVKTWRHFAYILQNQPETLDSEDRANLLNDAFALAHAGYLDFSIPLTMSNSLSGNSSRMELQAAFSGLTQARSKITNTKHPIKYYIHAILGSVYNDLLGEKDLDLTKNQLTKEEEFYILKFACKNEHKSCQRLVVKAFKDWIVNNVTPDPDFKLMVFTQGMKLVGTTKDWKVVLERYKAEHNPLDKQLLMHSLTSTKKEVLLKELLNLALEGGLVRDQDLFSVVTQVSGSNNLLVWEWFKTNYKKLVDKFTLEDRRIGRTFAAIVSRFKDAKKLAMVEEFLKKYPHGGASTGTRNMGLENIKSNINWIKTVQRSIDNHFKPTEPRENDESNNGTQKSFDAEYDDIDTEVMENIKEDTPYAPVRSVLKKIRTLHGQTLHSELNDQLLDGELKSLKKELSSL